MSWRARRAVAVLTAFLLGTLGLQLVVAQVDELPVRRRPIKGGGGELPMGKPRPTDASEFVGFDLPTDDALKDRLKDINVYIQVQDWPNAVDRLQQLLDRTDDLFAPVIRTDATGKETKHMVSVKAEATRIVGNLEKAGMDYYKVTFGPRAADDLKTAKATGDPALLAQVMKRYLYTDAGEEATELLATYMLDRGNYSAAALCFERLFQRAGPNKLAPLTLFKAALAFQRAGGDNKTNLDKAWKHLEDKGGNVKLGQKQFTIDELKNYVASRTSASRRTERGDWPMPGGGHSRSAQGDGTTAFLKHVWKADFVSDTTVKGWIARATQHLDNLKQPPLHGFVPITATLSRDDVKIPLFIYRSYFGIHARAVQDVPKEELKAGEIYWEAPSQWSMERMTKEPRHVGHLNQWMQTYNTVRPQIVLENSVVGALSTDNVRVYAVEDFQVPPYNQVMVGRGGVGGGPGGPIGDFFNHNRLQAYDLDSGKLLWEIGTADDKKDRDLLNSYFLGPPLPLNGKLYVLNEREQELRLLTIDPANGNLVTKPQRLADMRESIRIELARRFHAAHLAYGEGILVCPTNSGGILGVDLLTNSLVWAYGYRDPQAPQPGGGGPMGGPGFPGGGIGFPNPGIPGQPVLSNSANEWLATPPVITDGKVVFTAPDATAIHCLNLRDGSRLWKNARKEGDLYFAGVFAGKAVVVGKNYCRAINVADGSEAWNLETGVPSGFGIASKDIYYLPLSQAIKSREPELCLIDVSKGIVMAHTRSREKEIPGNLLFYEGKVLSQSLASVAAYPQLEVELKAIDALLLINHKNPEGLVRRGDLRLDKGDLAGATEDLRAALVNMDEKTPAEMKVRAKATLFECMTEFLQRDYSKAKKYIKEYETMCAEADPTWAPEQAKAELKKRKGNFYCLLGRGKEMEKDLVGAFEAYMNFGTLGAADNEMMSVVDDPGVKASAKVWARGRITAMVARASKEERAPLEKLVADRYAKIADSNDIDTLRNFVDTFGYISAVGRDARLQLAERLILDNADSSLVDAERHLSILRLQEEDKAMSARAVEAMARLMTRKGLMEDAAYFYRVLGRGEYAKAVIRDGKTGQEIYNDLATDKRFLPYLDEPAVMFGGKVKPRETDGGTSYQPNTYALQQEGERLPFFTQNFRVAVRSDYAQLKLFNREKNDEEAWSQTLNGSFFAQLYIYNQRNPAITPRPVFQNLGHLMLVQVGHKVFALDPVSKKQLWEKTLNSTAQPNFQSVIVDPRDGSTQVVYQGGWMQRLGRSGPLSPIAVPILTAEGLLGCDPVTGNVLWTRNDVSKNSHLYTDDQHVFTIEMATDGTVGSTRIFRLQDGVSIQTRDFSDVYRTRLLMLGRKILASDSTSRGVTLRLYDAVAGEDLYNKTFAPGSVVLQPETDDLGGIVEPSGKVTILDLKTLKEMTLRETIIDEKTRKVTAVREGMRPEHLPKSPGTLHLLKDHNNIYIAVSNPLDTMVAGTLTPNLMPGMGLKSMQVNGELYSFDATSGELNWFNHVPNQMLVLDEFERVPVVLLTARYRKWTDQFRQSAMYVATLRSYDKRTGKLIWDKEEPNGGRYVQFHAIRVDTRAGKVELLNSNLIWSHGLDNGPIGPGGGPGGQGGGPGPRSSGPGYQQAPMPPAFPPGAPRPQIRRLID